MPDSVQAPAQTTVLVIDDEPAVQAMASQALRAAGYNVLVAADANEAMRLSDSYPSEIHVVLTDIMLPSGNGIALAAALVEKRPNSSVLYMSGFPTDAIKAIQERGDNGPNGPFLAKPFLARTLVERVGSMVAANVRETAAAQGGDSPALVSTVDASYRLESPVKCPQCGETINSLKAVRLLRIQVNFTSTLPRRGRVLVCPECSVVVPGDLTNF